MSPIIILSRVRGIINVGNQDTFVCLDAPISLMDTQTKTVCSCHCVKINDIEFEVDDFVKVTVTMHLAGDFTNPEHTEMDDDRNLENWNEILITKLSPEELETVNLYKDYMQKLDY